MTTSSETPVSTLVHDIRQKQPLRDRLSRDVDEFMRNGGQTETLQPGEVTGRIDDEGEE